MTHSTTDWMLPAQMGINTIRHLSLDTPTNSIVCGINSVWVVIIAGLNQGLFTTDYTVAYTEHNIITTDQMFRFVYNKIENTEK